MIIGMDFGTTNSGMAVYDGKSVTLLPIDPSNTNPRVARTSLYVTNDQAIHIGREAIDYYFEQNTGRPVKLQKVWIGELEIYAEDLYYVTDAYAYVDVFSPGRLFLSMKTSLRDADYPGTVVGQFYYPLEDLIALYMTKTKIRAENILGQELRQVVLGRPVHFASDPDHDRLAQSRLLQAAFRAGYEKVYLQHEPVAAAFSYETTIDKEQHVLIFDFGGGTLDITVMRLGDPKRRAVLATGGVPIAGDLFDQKLVRTKLPRHFGEGSQYGPRYKALTIPQWIYDTFSNWNTILELQSTENKKILQEITQTARRKYQIEALISLVANNQGLHMFDVVERAKRKLSEKRGAEILLAGSGFKVQEFVTRTEFENIIRNDIRIIEQHLDETINTSGLTTEQIDAVIRTGGSSQIPVFFEMLRRKFGPEKVHSVDVFSSVTAGLGIIAHGIEKGEIDTKSYQEEDVKILDTTHTRPNVSPINLDIIQRRIVVDEMSPTPAKHEEESKLVFLGDDGQVTAVSLPWSKHIPDDPVSLSNLGLPENGIQARTARSDERLLLITTRYRFLLTTPRQIMDLAQINLAVTNLHQLEPYEKICTISSWDDLIRHTKLLVVTSSGYTRIYPMNILKTNVEAPIPMKFDNPLPGVPVVATGVNTGSGDDDQLILVTQTGRIVRIDLAMVLTSGFQAVNCSQDDRVIEAVQVHDRNELLLITADGYGRRLLVDWIPISDKANVKGKSYIARRSPVVGVTQILEDPLLRIITSRQVTRIDSGLIPLDKSTKTHRLIKLSADESIQKLFYLS